MNKKGAAPCEGAYASAGARADDPAPSSSASAPMPAPAPAATRIAAPAAAVGACLAGAGAMILEVAGAHALAPAFGTGLNAWSAMITVALCGLGLGYVLGGFAADRWSRHLSTRLLPAALALAGACCAADAFSWHAVVYAAAPQGVRLGAVLAAAALFVVPFILLGAVGPLAVRLWTASVGEVGRKSGWVSALSAGGSVAGAAAAGFALVPNLSLEAVFGCCAATLLSAAALVLVAGRGSRPVALGLLFGAALAPALPARPMDAGMLWRHPSLSGGVEVVEHEGIRYLLIARTVHGMASADGLHPLFPYVSAIAGTLEANKPLGSRVLLLGLGAGLLPRALPPGECESVEIDPAVAEAAARFFDCDPGLYPVRIADGRAFLLGSKERYGAVVIDAYGGWTYPYHLFTRECFELIRSRLAPGGLLVVNFQGYLEGPEAPLVRSLEATLREVFDEVEISAGYERGSFGNALMVARTRGVGFEWPADLSLFYEDTPTFQDGGPAPVLTDSRNPVDLWSAAAERAIRGRKRVGG